MTADGRPTLLVLTSTYPRWRNDSEPGFVHELAKRLVDSFHVIVLCPRATGALPREVLDGVEVVRYRYAPERWETLVNDGGIVSNLRRNRWKFLLLPSFLLMQMWNAWKLMRNKDVDVIHAHWLVPQGLIAAFLNMFSTRKVPFVVTSHGADLYALRGGIMDAAKRFVLRKAIAATVVSSAMRDMLHLTGVDISRVSIRPMGVDMQGRFNIDVSEVRSNRDILFVGRLVEKKGVCYLLEAMPEVARCLPGTRLAIVGFGPEQAALKAQVSELGLGDIVQFLGAISQDELPALYRHAALFVAPFVRAASGDQEGLGLVLVEAISCGCPILAGNVPALAEVLGKEFDDMAIDPKDTNAFAQRIVGVLAEPEEAQARAAKLRKTIGKRFDWDNVAEEYASLLKLACAVDAGARPKNF